MLIKDVIQNIYEKSKTPYPHTPERAEAQEKFLVKAVNFNSILDLGFGDGYTLKLLRKHNPTADIFGFTGNPNELKFINDSNVSTYSAMDMHKWLESFHLILNTHGLRSLDMILARHIVEHSIMPFAVLCLLNSLLKIDGKLFIVLPQDNLDMIKYKNHYSVLSKNLWERLFKLSGFSIDYYNEDQFQRNPNGKEWQYILNKVSDPIYT